MKRKDITTGTTFFLLSQVQLLLLWLWPVLRLCGGPPYKVIEYQIDVRISKGISGELTSSYKFQYSLSRGDRGGDGAVEGENTTRRKVARTFSDMYTPLSLLYLSHLKNDKKRTVANKWSKQPTFLNPHRQDHQPYHPRWFEGRTHGERRRPRRTRTPMMPMTPLDNKPLGRFENVFLQCV